MDEDALRRNVNIMVEGLRVDGHYCSGNVAEFWKLTVQERKRVHEVMLEAAGGRIPMMAGVHDQSLDVAIDLAFHAQGIGYDFVIALTPYFGTRNDDLVYEYFERLCTRLDIGVVLFNQPYSTHPLSPALLDRLADLPNVCGMKQTDLNPHATLLVEEAVGDRMVIGVADEVVWFHNMSQLGHRWLVNYTPHMYQVPGWLPIKEYTDLYLSGEVARAEEVSRSLGPLRAAHAKWMMEPWSQGKIPIAAMKHWMQLIGMEGGPARPPSLPLSTSERDELRADLERTGILARAAQGAGA